MSHIFLGESKVYKLKRSFRHPFCDMSTVEQRRIACEAELAVNRPLAPSVYEMVAAVTRSRRGRIEISGDGEILDWVVVMRRFPDGCLLSEIAAAGQLTAAQISELAHVVAGFHLSLQPHRECGHVADYRRIIEGLRRTEAEGAAAQGLQAASQALFDDLERELGKWSPLIEARRNAGWVRRGHGDLHLNNICLFEGRVTPFDALEFDASLATTDVLYDLAFLLMDLRGRGLDHLANLAMNGYWDETHTAEPALALLPLFMALRAAVRMAVAVEAGDLVEASRYRALGESLLHGPKPRLLAIGGLSGTGKSSIARAVAADLPGPCGARVLRSDSIRKAAAGVAPTVRLGARAYGSEARADVYKALCAGAREVLRAGSSVIADATFQASGARDAILGSAGKWAALGIWLRAPASVRVQRINARTGDASDATAQIALSQVEPVELGQHWRIIDAGPSVVEIASNVRATFSE